MKFKGKIAPWWYLVTTFFNGITIALFIVKKMDKSCWMFIPLLIILDLYLIPVFFQNYVTVDKKNVIVQFGILKKTIPTQEIVAVKETHAPHSSFSASFDRIGIESRRITTVYIAIEDKKGFLQALQKVNRKIKYIVG